MELAGQRHHSRTAVHVLARPGGNEGTRDAVDGVSQSWLLRAHSHSGGGTRTGAQVHTRGGASTRTARQGTPGRMDPRVRRHIGEMMIIHINNILTVVPRMKSLSARVYQAELVSQPQ